MSVSVSAVYICVSQTLHDSAVSNYASSLKDKGALVPALYKVIRENYSDVWTQFYIFIYVHIVTCMYLSTHLTSTF